MVCCCSSTDLVSVSDHSTEFENTEVFSPISPAERPIKHRWSIFGNNGQRNDSVKRESYHEERKCKQEANYTFYKTIIDSVVCHSLFPALHIQSESSKDGVHLFSPHIPGVLTDFLYTTQSPLRSLCRSSSPGHNPAWFSLWRYRHCCA